MTQHCTIHRGDIPAGVRAVLVSAIEQGSGPGIPIYACQPCVAEHEVVPFAELPGDDAQGAYGQRPLGVRRAP
jgi:hypothetical protein